MIINKNSFYVTVSFEPSDWFPGGNAREVMQAIKDNIPSSQRSYDPETKIWKFPSVKEYVELIERFTHQGPFSNEELREADKAISDLFETLDRGQLV